jgi:hypothetical protein
MKTKKTTCKQALKHVCDNLDSSLNSRKCREIRRHLEACPDCRAYLDSLKQTISLYRNYPIPKAPHITGIALRNMVRTKS